MVEEANERPKERVSAEVQRCRGAEAQRRMAIDCIALHCIALDWLDFAA